MTLMTLGSVGIISGDPRLQPISALFIGVKPQLQGPFTDGEGGGGKIGLLYRAGFDQIKRNA